MAVLWQSSPAPFIDLNGNPIPGIDLYFFLATTTTPLTVYRDGALSTSWAQPIQSDASGVFPAVFLPPTTYKQRLVYPDGTIREVDSIDPPQAASYVPPSAGSTDVTLLFSTGMLVSRHGTDVLTGWVRGNGRTIGNAASGATERANADTSALFQYLWTQDSTLTVSSGRGGTAAGDFAANKTIALPDYRSRSIIGRGTMGNTAAGLIADAVFDNSETADTLGATVGAATQTISVAQLPVHTPAGSVTARGNLAITASGTVDNFNNNGVQTGSGTGALTGPGALAGRSVTVTASGTFTDSGSTFAGTSIGSGAAHANVQPSVAVTIYLKL